MARSQASVPAVALVAPVAALRRQDVLYLQRHQVLGLFVSERRRDLQSEGSPMTAIQGAIVHFVAEQRLRVPGSGHVERLVRTCRRTRQ